MSRFYDTPIGNLVSVTTITGVWDKSGALTGWAAKETARRFRELMQENKNRDLLETEKKAKREFRNLSKKALDIGSEVHNLIEVHLKGQSVHLSKYDDKVKNGYNAYIRWEEASKFKIVAAERRMYSEKGFAGTADCLCTLDGKLHIIDFKTGKSVYEPGFSMQLAAYRDMINDGYAEVVEDYQKKWKPSKNKVTKGGILVLNKETGVPTWNPYKPELLDLAFGQFMDMLGAWRKNEERKNIRR